MSSSSSCLPCPVAGCSPPLLLPSPPPSNYFYVSPHRGPCHLVLAIIVPTGAQAANTPLPTAPGVLDGDGDLNYTVNVQSSPGGPAPSASAGAAKNTRKSIFSYLADMTNTVTNTAASSIGVPNKLELNRPKLKLVERSGAVNERWGYDADNQCIFSFLDFNNGNYSYTLSMNNKTIPHAVKCTPSPDNVDIFDVLKLKLSVGKLHSLIHSACLSVVIEQGEQLNPPSLSLNLAANLSLTKQPSALDPNLSKLLVIKNTCCSNLDCESEKIKAGSHVSFKNHQENRTSIEHTVDEKSKKKLSLPQLTLPPLPPLSTFSPLSVWHLHSEFSIWLSTLKASMMKEYEMNVKMEKSRLERAQLLQKQVITASTARVPIKFEIDYKYQLLWSEDGVKPHGPVHLVRPTLPAHTYVFFGDHAFNAKDESTRKQVKIVNNHNHHPAFVVPTHFQLLYSRKKNKMGMLHVWLPRCSSAVDALALGCVCTLSSDAPSLHCGVVLVRREYLKDTCMPYSQCVWSDAANVPAASFYLHPTLFTCITSTSTRYHGTSYTFLEANEIAESFPLLRSIETSTSNFDLVWDDRNTLSKQDLSIWRPRLHDTYVRFGDQLVHNYEPPTSSACIAKDHPAFVQPERYELSFKIYRAAKKVYVWKPVHSDSQYIALGYLITDNKNIPPCVCDVRMVHMCALAPIGTRKQMWIEYYGGMVGILSSTATLGLISNGKENVYRMLWKNKELNTFSVMENTHAPPSLPAFRLPFSPLEQQSIVSYLELHTQWVLESMFSTLTSLEEFTQQHEFEQINLSPQQVALLLATIQHIVNIVFQSSSSSSPANASASPNFSISASFKSYLSNYQIRLSSIHSALRRYVYNCSLSAVSDDFDIDYSVEKLDEIWCMVVSLPPFDKRVDRFDTWTNKPKFKGDTAPIVQCLFEKIGEEIANQFFKRFPPTLRDSIPFSPFALQSSSSTSVPDVPVTLSAEQTEMVAKRKEIITNILADMKDFAGDLDVIRDITTEFSLRKLFLERYQQYFVSTLHTLFQWESMSMSELLLVSQWLQFLLELEQDLLEGDSSPDADKFIQNTIDEIDRYMDAHDNLAKEKIIIWVGNILRQEEKASAELDDHKWYTNGPTDIFNNINTLYDNQRTVLTGRALARVALMHFHVLSFFQECQIRFLDQIATIDDENYKAVNTPTIKPYSYILAQINNVKYYQVHTDEFSARVLRDINDSSSSILDDLESCFDDCLNNWLDVGLAAVHVFVRRFGDKMSTIIEKLWTQTDVDDEKFFEEAVLDELDELYRQTVKYIEQQSFKSYFLFHTLQQVLIVYVRVFVANVRGFTLLQEKNKPIQQIIHRLNLHQQAILEFYKGQIDEEKLSKSVEIFRCLIEFLGTEPTLNSLNRQVPAFIDTFQLHPKGNIYHFANYQELKASQVLQACCAIRGELSSDDRKSLLAPFAAELNQKPVNKPFTFSFSQSSVLPTANLNVTHPYGLEIQIIKGDKLIVKDITTSDPYVNILLLNNDGGRVAKRKSSYRSRTLNPVWEETFCDFTPGELHNFCTIRFEVWDHDTFGKDFMGFAQVQLEEVKQKQLLNKKSSLFGKKEDETQIPIPFHLALQCLEGRRNEGSDAVSGSIDVRIKYYKLDDATLQKQRSTSSSSSSALSVTQKRASIDPTAPAAASNTNTTSTINSNPHSPPANLNSTVASNDSDRPSVTRLSSTSLISDITQGGLKIFNTILFRHKKKKPGFEDSAEQAAADTNKPCDSSRAELMPDDAHTGVRRASAAALNLGARSRASSIAPPQQSQTNEEKTDSNAKTFSNSKSLDDEDEEEEAVWATRDGKSKKKKNKSHAADDCVIS